MINGYMPSVSSLHDITEPSSANSTLNATISAVPLARKRWARWAIPRSSAPVANTTVMNPPIVRMKTNTWTAPNIAPLLKGPICPVSSSTTP